MKKFFLFFFILLPLMAVAQNKKHFDTKEFEYRMEMMLIDEANLSDKEASAFSPIFRNFQASQRKVGKAIRKLKSGEYESAQQYSNALSKIRSLEVKMVSLAEDYTKELLKVLPAKKVFQLMKVEDEFRRSIVKGKRGKKANNMPPPQGDPFMMPQNEWGNFMQEPMPMPLNP